MNLTKAVAVGGTMIVSDMALFSHSSSESMKDGANMAVSSLIGDMLAPQTESYLPAGFSDLTSLAVSGLAYTGIDSIIDASPFNGWLGKFIYGMGVQAAAANTLYPLIANNTLFNGSQ